MGGHPQRKTHRSSFLLPVGLGIGVALGAAIHNIGAGLAMGAGIGTILSLLGWWFEQRKN